MTAALALLPAAAAAQLTPAERAALAELGPEYAQQFDLKRGWFRATPILYFDIGPQDPGITPVFLLATSLAADGTPTLLPDQRPIVASIPGLTGFSAIMQVHYLLVPAGFPANSVRDARAALALGLSGRARLVIPGTYVNYSIVPAGSSLLNDPARRPLLTAWFKSAEVAYFDFGPASEEPAPIFTFVTGEDQNGPRFLRAQANIVDVVPERGVVPRDLWDVHFVRVPEVYAPDSVRSIGQLSGMNVRRIGQIRNCPVVLIDGQRAGRTP